MAKPARKQKSPPKRARNRGSRSDYFTQPGKRGAIIVLRKPIGNRAAPKVCGTMPSRVHAKMLIDQLERAESVVKDLFLEATDDGIEALEAVLAACRNEVLERGPKQRPQQPRGRPEREQPLEQDSSDAPDAPYAGDSPDLSEPAE
jgi:hypothetical protein